MPESHAVYPRPVLDRLPAYAAGKPPATLPNVPPYKLSSNENPYGPVEPVREVIRGFADGGQVLRYPETTYAKLRATIAKTFGINADDITVGAGSLGALTQLIYTYAGANEDGSADEVIIPWRSFEAYPIVIRTAGAKDVQVPVKADGSIDLDGMREAITDKTRVILLCTPNNPTGPVLHTQEVDDFIASVPPHIMVVIDEAYIEFVRDDNAVNGLEMLEKYPNVVVLRTFSKAHGLANLRVGYSVSRPEITKYLRVIATPFATSTLAEEAAIASLEHLDDVHLRVENVVKERERVITKLREIGYDVPESHANFVWMALGDKTPLLVDACNAQSLSVRGFGNEGARVSIGEVEANDRFLEIVEEMADQLLS